MAPSTWRFVDSPTSNPGVLLDMNNGTTWRTISDDFDVSPPPLRRQIVSNSMTDGGLLTAASYELREITFTVQLEGTEAARNQALKDLGRELAKPSNLLMYRSQHASIPVFFRTLRSDNWELDNQLSPGYAWRVKVSVLAEPFALGIRQDLPPVTVSNDPAAGTNPTRFDLTGIVGDAPSPAFVRIASLGAGGTVMLSSRTVNNPTALTAYAQAESGTMLIADTNTWAAGATFSGSGNNATATTFASGASLLDRLSVVVPSATSGSALRGTYRVFARCFLAAAATTTTFKFRIIQDGDPSGGTTITGTTIVNSLDPGTFKLVDLGLIECPRAMPRTRQIGYSGLDAGFVTSERLRLGVSRVSGNGNLDCDFIYLFPADESFLVAQQTQATGIGYLVLDGPGDAVYTMATGSSPFDASIANRGVVTAGGLNPRIGKIPSLVPGVTNRWYMLTNGTVSSTKVVDVSYWPRWREVAT